MANPSVVINNVIYPTVPEVDIPISGGGTAKFYFAGDTDFAAGDLLTGKSAVGPSGLVNGSMPSNGDVSAEIDTKNGTVSIPAGKTTGGTVGLKASAVADLISANLLRGKEVLGIQGTLDTVSVSQDSTTKVLSIA